MPLARATPTLYQLAAPKGRIGLNWFVMLAGDQYPVPSAQSLDGIEWLLFRNINRISNRFFSQAPFLSGFLENTQKHECENGCGYTTMTMTAGNCNLIIWSALFVIFILFFFFLAWKHLIAYCEM